MGEHFPHVQCGAEGACACVHVCMSDLWSRAEQLLVFKPQSFFLQLQLLQSHLVVSSHDSRVLGAGRELGALLHWSTLGNPLLVQSYTGRFALLNLISLGLYCIIMAINNFL